MNANEVIATLAGDDVHPNDHVNMGQSSNDVFPSAVHLAALDTTVNELLPALELLAGALEDKAGTFADIVKSGRTHMMDAVPVTLGQEFSGYAAQVRQGIARVADVLPRLGQIPLGGTATGTGLNTHAEFAARVRELLHADTGLPISPPADPFESQAARDGLVELSGALKVVAVSLTKIASDLRLMGSGPRAGLVGAAPAGAAEGLVDHAGQGQPGDPRGRDAGRGAGDRERHGDHDRRHERPVRAERLRPAPRPEPAPVDRPARERVTPVRGEVHCGAGAEPRAERGLRGRDAERGDRAQPVHRLRQGVGDRQGGRRVRPLAARGRAGGGRRGAACSTRRSTTTRWPARTTRPDGPYPFLGYPVGVCNEEPSCGYGFALGVRRAKTP